MVKCKFLIVLICICNCLSSAENSTQAVVDFQPGLWFNKCPSIAGWEQLHHRLARNSTSFPSNAKPDRKANFAAAELVFYDREWQQVAHPCTASYWKDKNRYHGFISGTGVTQDQFISKISGRGDHLKKMHQRFETTFEDRVKKYHGEELKGLLEQRAVTVKEDINSELKSLSDAEDQYNREIYQTAPSVRASLFHSEKSIIRFFNNFFPKNNISEIASLYPYAVLHLHTKFAMCASCLTNMSLYLRKWQKEYFSNSSFSIVVSCEKDYPTKENTEEFKNQFKSESECEQMSHLCSSLLKQGSPGRTEWAPEDLKKLKEITTNNIELFLKTELVGQFFLSKRQEKEGESKVEEKVASVKVASSVEVDPDEGRALRAADDFPQWQDYASTDRGSGKITKSTPLFYVSMQELGKNAREQMVKSAISSREDVHPADQEPNRSVFKALSAKTPFRKMDKETQGYIRNMRGLLIKNHLRGREEYSLLSSWLASAEQLEELDLSYNTQLSEFFGNISAALEAVLGGELYKPLQKLKALYLDGVPLTGGRSISPRESVSLAQGFQEFLSLCPNLISLHIPETALGVEGAKALNEWLLSTQRVERLDLRECDIGDEGINFLMPGLLRQKKLRYFNVIKNGIAASGAKIIANSLPNFLELKHLYLGENKLGDAGAIDLVGGFKRLVAAVIEAHKAGERGEEERKTDAAADCWLQTIDLSYNSIGKEGLRKILTWLNSLGPQGDDVSLQLMRLSLEGNKFGFENATYCDEDNKKYWAYLLFDVPAAAKEKRLPQPFTYLETLGLSFEPSTSDRGEKVIKKLADQLNFFSELKNLVVIPLSAAYVGILEKEAASPSPNPEGEKKFNLKAGYSA